MTRISKNYKLLDPTTGEVIPIDITFRKLGQGGKFMKLWQDTALYLIKRHPEIRGFSLRILLYLTAKAEWNNVIPSPHSASVELKLLETSCYRAYAELLKADFLMKREGTYYLSPFYCWKGDEKQYGEACRQLLCSPTTLLENKQAQAILKGSE